MTNVIIDSKLRWIFWGRKLGKIEGIEIKNYGPLRNVILGKTRTHQNAKALSNLVTIIGPSGNGKSTYCTFNKGFTGNNIMS